MVRNTSHKGEHDLCASTFLRINFHAGLGFEEIKVLTIRLHFLDTDIDLAEKC